MRNLAGVCGFNIFCNFYNLFSYFNFVNFAFDNKDVESSLLFQDIVGRDHVDCSVVISLNFVLFSA